MAILNFPSEPQLNELYEENGVSYVWDGNKWVANNAESLTEEFVNVSGDNMTGDLTLGAEGSPKLTFDASAGSITAVGDVKIGGTLPSTPNIELKSNGEVSASASLTAGNETNQGIVYLGGPKGNGNRHSNPYIQLYAGGPNVGTADDEIWSIEIKNDGNLQFDAWQGGAWKNPYALSFGKDGSITADGQVFTKKYFDADNRQRDGLAETQKGRWVMNPGGVTNVGSYSDYSSGSINEVITFGRNGDVTADGLITTGVGIKFPDGTTQTSAIVGGGGGDPSVGTLLDVCGNGNFTTTDVLIGNTVASPNIELKDDGNITAAGGDIQLRHDASSIFERTFSVNRKIKTTLSAGFSDNRTGLAITDDPDSNTDEANIKLRSDGSIEATGPVITKGERTGTGSVAYIQAGSPAATTGPFKEGVLMQDNGILAVYKQTYDITGTGYSTAIKVVGSPDDATEKTTNFAVYGDGSTYMGGSLPNDANIELNATDGSIFATKSIKAGGFVQNEASQGVFINGENGWVGASRTAGSPAHALWQGIWQGERTSIIRAEGSASFNSDVQMASLNGGQIAFRNKLINGDFSQWQRGTSFTSSGSGEYTTDRWRNNSATSGANIFRLRSGTHILPEGFDYGIRSNLEASDLQQGIELALEGQAGQFYQGSQWTLSGWCDKDPTTRTPNVAFRDGVQITADQSKVTTTAWQSTGETSNGYTRYACTFTIDVAPTANNKCLVVESLMRGGGAGASITGMMLEPGPVATPFEHRPIGTELALCQRYFYRTTSRINTSKNCTKASPAQDNQGFVNVFFPVTMRAIPDIDPDTVSLNVATDATVAQRGTNTVMIFMTSTTTNSANSCGLNGGLEMDAEL